MIRIKALLLFLLAATTHPVFAQQVHWQSIRDGSFIILSQAEDSLTIEWKDAWLSDANAEEVYLINSNGELAEKITIDQSNRSGQYKMKVSEKSSPYKLIIPGYSFRNYKISHGERTLSLFEPNKVHFSADIPRQAVIFFKSPENSNVQFSGKYHSGARKITLKRLSDNFTVNLELQNYDDYQKFNSIQLPSSNADEVWQVTFNSSGKVAFWLDGAENLFALSPTQLQSVNLPDAYTAVVLTDLTVGSSPDIGVALPYLTPPSNSHAMLDSLHIKSASFYSFVDVITQDSSRELEFRTLYDDKFNIKNNITLLAGTQRKAVLEANTEAFNALSLWAEDSTRLDHRANHYIAFADEPNLNFGSYEAFSSYFSAMLSHLKNTPNFSTSAIKVAVPASSRFLDGPFRPAAKSRLGIDWTRRLLAEHDADIQAIAWHEWMTRNLYATRRYQDSIRAAADLVGLDSNGKPKKALLIDQTNISSGNSVSPYEQDTQYAALWWASVIINSSQDGLLEMLNWFHIADEIDHKKGLIAVSDKGQLQLKPVGKAHAFLTENWLKNVKKTANTSFEVDVLHSQNSSNNQLIGVNKSTRKHHMAVKLSKSCPAALRLRIFDAQSVVHDVDYSCTGETLSFNLPEQSIFKAEWKSEQ